VAKEISVKTEHKTEIVNITDQLAGLVADAPDGIALLSSPHTTAALLISEDDEELRRDLVQVAQKWLAEFEPFEHRKRGNPNAAAHILSAFGGSQLTVAVEGGRLALGKYQNVLLLEMDGPKSRTVRCTVIAG
jgi:secondary thiamine-phosphate synthase enzyme